MSEPATPSAVKKDDFLGNILPAEEFVPASDLPGATPDPPAADPPGPGTIADPPKDPLTPGAAPAAAPEFLKTLGNFENVDQLKTVVQRGMAVTDDDVTNIETYRKSQTLVTELQNQVQELAKTPSFKNPILAKLDRFAESNPDEYSLAQKVMLGEVDDIELIRHELIHKNPALKDNPAALQRKIQRTYPGLFESKGEDGSIPVDKTSEQYLNDLDDLQMEAGKIRADIKAKVEAIELPAVRTEDLAAQEAVKTKALEVKTSWEAAKPALLTSLTPELPVVVPSEGNKIKEVYKLEVPIDQLNPFLDIAIASGIKQGNKFATENSPVVIETAKRLWIANNLPAYNAALLEAHGKAKDIEWRQHVNNAGGLPGVTLPGGDGGDDQATAIFKDVITKI